MWAFPYPSYGSFSDTSLHLPWDSLLLGHSLEHPTFNQSSQSYCFMNATYICSGVPAPRREPPFLCSTAEVPEVLTPTTDSELDRRKPPSSCSQVSGPRVWILRYSRSWFSHWFWHTNPRKPEDQTPGVTFLRLSAINTPLFDLTCDGTVGLGKEFYTENPSLLELWKSSFPCHLVSAACKEKAAYADFIYRWPDFPSGSFWDLLFIYFWNCPLSGLEWVFLIHCVRHSVGLFNLGDVFLFS